MKKLFLFILLIPTLLFAQTAWNGTANTTWYTNNPSDSTYTITTAEQLAGLAQLVNDGTNFNGKTITLGANIVLNDTNTQGGWRKWDSTTIGLQQWIPIGSDYQHGFEGSFDGNGKTVSGLYINAATSYQGLFGYQSYTLSNIVNLGLVGFYVKTSSCYVGGIAGHSALIANSYAIGNVSGLCDVGGIASSGKVINSYFIGNVFAKSTSSRGNAGGIIGSYTGGNPTNSYYNSELVPMSNLNSFGTPKTTADMQTTAFHDTLQFGASVLNVGSINNISIRIKNFIGWTYNANGYPSFSGAKASPLAVSNFFTNGSGTYADPYIIMNESQLENLAILVNLGNTFLDQYIKLGADIILNDTTGWLNWSDTTTGLKQWVRIGKDTYSMFKGNFDGNSKVISGLYIKDSLFIGTGLFGYVSGAAIKNLGLESFYVKNTSSSVGGIIGRHTGNYTLVANSYAIGNVSGGSPVGGISGAGGKVENSYFVGSVTVIGSNVGGISGVNATAENSFYNSDLVTASNSIGNPATTPQMKTQSTYSAWDFTNIWTMFSNVNDGYPFFKKRTLSLQNSTITFDDPPYEYTGKEVEPIVTITYAGNILAKNSYYTLSYSNNVNASDTATITITWIDGFSETVNFTISPLQLTWNTDGTVSNKAYDRTTTAIVNTAPTLIGVLENDYVTPNVGSVNFNNASAGTDKLIFATGYGITGAKASNYATPTAQPLFATANITQLQLAWDANGTVRNKTYDGTTTATVNTAPALVGIIGSDIVTPDIGSVNFNNANAGTDKPVTATGYGITGADAANYTVLQPAFATANITPLQLKWNANGTVRNKTYDGTRTATVSTAPALVGILGNDDVRPAVGAVNFDNMNIGTSKDVTATGYEITGTSASNYITPTAQPSFAKANITPLQLTWANGTVSDKTYDGTTTATTNIQPALNGVIEDDDVTPVFGSASFSDASAGTAKSVTATGYNIAGSDASNYAIITPPAFATAKITPLQLTWTNGTASDKTYDGTRIATVNIPPALIGIIEGDVVTPSVGTINFSDANVGTDKPVTATGYSIIGTDANNYAITAQPLFATANITHRTITVTPDADQSKVYGTTKDPVLAYTYSGNANGETPGFTGALSRISGDNAGSYAISKGSLAISDNGSFLVSNYTPLAMSSAPVYFTITKATGTGWVKIEGWYAGETPNSPNPYSETNPGAGVTYKYQGVSSTEYPLQSTPPSNPGSYKVTAAFPPAENHYFSAEAFFEVKQKANVQVIWTPACGHEYIYNGKEQRPTPSAAGYASSDFVLTGAGTNADSYTMTAELKTPDKGVSLQNAACPYTIAEKQLTVSWDAQREFTYNKMVQYPQASVKDGETNIPLHISGTQSAAGTHSIMAIITNELTRKNYALQSNTMDYTIFKKDLTPKFQTTLPDFEYKNDTLRVPTEVFQDTAALQQILDSIVAYEGFATDTVKKETDDAKILTGKAKVKIDYDDQDGNSQGKQGRFLLAKRVETTQKATATIITDDVSADNYKPLDRSITIVEMGDDDEGGPATFCKREDGRCIALNAEICEFIYGEVVPTCGEVPIPNTPNPIPYTPVTPRYYSLKGTFLGTIKPTAPGIYIEARGVKTKKIIVK